MSYYENLSYTYFKVHENSSKGSGVKAFTQAMHYEHEKWLQSWIFQPLFCWSACVNLLSVSSVMCYHLFCLCLLFLICLSVCFHWLYLSIGVQWWKEEHLLSIKKWHVGVTDSIASLVRQFITYTSYQHLQHNQHQSTYSFVTPTSINI